MIRFIIRKNLSFNVTNNVNVVVKTPRPLSIFVLVPAFCLLVVTLMGCDKEKPEQDVIQPEIVITSPINGSIIGEPCTINITAIDNDAIDSVLLFIDGEKIFESVTAPYTFYWDVYYYADDEYHSIFAQAVDPSGNRAISEMVYVRIKADAKFPPHLLEPGNLSEIRDNDHMTFRWNAHRNAISYNFQASTDSLFTTMEYSYTQTDTFTASLPFTQDLHFWRVSIIDTLSQNGPWSETRRFSVDGPLTPSLKSPTHESMLLNTTIQPFTWTRTPFSVEYNLNVSTESDFSSIVISLLLNDTFYVPSEFPMNAYYWRIRSKNSVGFWNEWSTARTFAINVFTRHYTTSASDYGRSVKETSDGGFIIASKTYNPGFGSGDILLIKTNSIGAEEWRRQFGGPLDDNVCSIIIRSNGNFIIGGFKEVSPNNSDFMIIETDPTGQVLWTKTYGRSGFDYAGELLPTNDGGYILAGYSMDPSGDHDDVYLVKTNAAGDTAWTKFYGGPQSDEAFSVKQTIDGGYVLTGRTMSYGVGNGDIYLIKTDLNGIMQWSHTYGTYGMEQGTNLTLTNDGGFIITGWNGNFYLMKTDQNGVELWNRFYGGGMNNFGTYISPVTSGGFILTGVDYYDGKGKIRLIKIDDNGNPYWNALYGNRYDLKSYSVIQCSDGGFVVVGQAFNTQTDDYNILLLKTNSVGRTLFPENF